MEFLNNIKKWIRKNYLKLRYMLNWNTGKLITIYGDDKDYDLSTMMFDGYVLNGYRIFIPSHEHKLDMYDKIYFYLKDVCETNVQQLGVRRDILNGAYDDMFIVPEDIKRGRFALGVPINVIVDSSCTVEDIQILYDAEFYSTKIKIVNGFVYRQFHKL